MKIECKCGHLIIDNIEKYKGHQISDTQWFKFWDAIDDAIENSGTSKKDKEKACMGLRKLNLFKQMWECGNCGKIYFDSENGDLVSYSPDSGKYNASLVKKQ